MGAIVVVFDLITERWPCMVGVLEWCQVTMAGYAAAAAAAQVCAWSFRTPPTCSPPRIHLDLVTY